MMDAGARPLPKERERERERARARWRDDAGQMISVVIECIDVSSGVALNHPSH